MALFLAVLVLVLDIVLVIALSLLTVFFLVFFLRLPFLDAPFVPVRNHALAGIVQALQLDEHSRLYDLGCGDARVLVQAVKHTKEAEGVGVEKNILAYALARWNSKGLPIEIRYQDLMSVSLHEATHIYLYMFPEIVQKISKKIQRECLPGTRIVACDFPLEDMQPDSVLDISSPDSSLAKKLFVYTLKA